MTSSVPPVDASTHSPAIRSRGLRFKNAATAVDGLGCAAIATAFTGIPPGLGSGRLLSGARRLDEARLSMNLDSTDREGRARPPHASIGPRQATDRIRSESCR